MPPPRWLLKSFEIHVWAASLRQTVERISTYERTLSPDEQARSARFRFDCDRHRFIAGRGLLRAILARYLQEDPSHLVFDYNRRGKPFLVECGGQNPLYFNLTHSEDLALFAVTWICNIGIDVERMCPLSDAKGIAARFFSPSERDGLKALSEVEEPIAFFNLWTRKEAWLKATGDGIGDSLNQVEVSFLASEPARLIRLFGNAETAQEWSLLKLLPAPDFIGALAVPAKNVSVDCWHWIE